MRNIFANHTSICPSPTHLVSVKPSFCNSFRNFVKYFIRKSSIDSYRNSNRDCWKKSLSRIPSEISLETLQENLVWIVSGISSWASTENSPKFLSKIVQRKPLEFFPRIATEIPLKISPDFLFRCFLEVPSFYQNYPWKIFMNQFKCSLIRKLSSGLQLKIIFLRFLYKLLERFLPKIFNGLL